MSLFSTLKYLKINWLKNKTKDCGAQSEVIRLCPLNDIIVKSWTVKHGQAWTSCSELIMLNLIIKNHGLYEIISKYPHKVYFDIDCVDVEVIKSASLLPKLLVKLNELFPDSDLSVSGSVTLVKESYHIVLNKYMINSVEDRNHIKAILKHLSLIYPEVGYDWKVYTDNRAMKAINQSKTSDTRLQSIILNSDPKKHLITCFFDPIQHPLPQYFPDADVNVTIQVEKVKRTKFDICKLPEIKLSQSATTGFDFCSCTAKQVLSLLPLNLNFDHAYTHLVSRFCFYNNLSFSDFILWYNQKRDDIDSRIKWSTHWDNLSKFPIVTLESMKYVLLKYYPSLIKEKKFIDYQNLFHLTDTVVVPTLTQSVFDSPNRGSTPATDGETQRDSCRNCNKYIILNTNMGSGKTFQTIEYLKDKDSFCWMTPLISLSLNTMDRLTTANIKCKYYKDCKDTSEKNNLNNFDKLVICINSLKYITSKTYSIVVIDEIESLLNKWFNNKTLKADTKFNCWKSFIHIIRSADKVIFLDAFTSKITLNFIKDLEYNTQKPIIYTLLPEESKRNVCFLLDYAHWLSDIITQLKAGKKLFIFYPLKDSIIHKNLPSMEGLVNIITINTGTKGIFYHGEVDHSVMKGLECVNDTWSKYNFVVTNTKITVGVNFDLQHFDLVYLGVGGWNSARDLIQVSYRCRKLKENLIKVTFIDRINTNRDFKRDEVNIHDCSIYQGLVSQLLVEKYAPLQESLYFLVNKANYKIINSDEVFDRALKTRFKKLFDDLNITYNYSSVEDLHPDDLEKCQNSIMSQDATQMMQIQMKKYYYDNLFTFPEENSVEFNLYIASGWDNNYESFFDSIKIVKQDVDFNNSFHKVFNSIKILNNWEMIIPFDIEDLSKILMTKEIKAELCKLFHFQYLSDKSSSIYLLKSALNTFFSKEIISSKKDKDNNTTFFIKETIKNMYNFGMTYLKIPKVILNNIEL